MISNVEQEKILNLFNNEGWSKRRIEKEFKVSNHVVRKIVDPSFIEKELIRNQKRKSTPEYKVQRKKKDREYKLRTRPQTIKEELPVQPTTYSIKRIDVPKYRNQYAELFGEPPIGRSALDQRMRDAS